MSVKNTFSENAGALIEQWIPFTVSYGGKQEAQELPRNYTIMVGNEDNDRWSLNNNQILALSALGFHMMNGNFYLFGEF